MSVRHPIIAVTGSTGAGRTTVRRAFQDIFLREGISAVFVEGNGFRRYDREAMRDKVREASAAGRPISHFGPRANLFDRLEGLFREYSRTATGILRHYVETEEDAARLGRPVGSFTPWEDIPEGSDLLLYEGMHGGCIESTWSHRHMSASHNPFVIQERHKLETRHDEGVDVAQWVDLLIGVAPTVNLEWIQKIQREQEKKGASAEAASHAILRRMPDYLHYIVPQFSLTDINFQRVPLVDTSHPFIARDVPTANESMVVIRFREPKKVDFPNLLRRIHDSFITRPNTLVVPGGEMLHAMETICAPMVHELVARKRAAVG
jgi:phosphoribulokinase